MCVGERATQKPLGNVLKSIVQRKITLLKRDCSSKEPVMTALCRCDCSELVALELGARACKAWPGSSSGGMVAQGEVLAGVVEEADRVSQGFGSLSGLPRNTLQVKSFYSFLSLPGASVCRGTMLTAVRL